MSKTTKSSSSGNQKNIETVDQILKRTEELEKKVEMLEELVGAMALATAAILSGHIDPSVSSPSLN